MNNNEQQPNDLTSPVLNKADVIGSEDRRTILNQYFRERPEGDMWRYPGVIRSLTTDEAWDFYQKHLK